VLVHGPKLADRLEALVRHLLVGHTNLAAAMQVDSIGLAARFIQRWPTRFCSVRVNDCALAGRYFPNLTEHAAGIYG
jgi:hypothetical protein